MSKHTPEPWRLELLEDRSIKHLCPVGPDDMSILTIVEHDGKPFAAIYKDADAHLIAAAPDLLAALQGVMRVADRKTDEFDAARAAIQKATGAA